MQISKTPISTENVVLFQKITVIITDIAVLFGAASISKVKRSENRCLSKVHFRANVKRSASTSARKWIFDDFGF